MRIFLAIPVSEDIKELASQARRELESSGADVKWVERCNYHLTLKFLGEVDPTMVELIKDRLEQVAESCPPFRLTFSKLGFFPGHTRPRVVWIGVGGEMDKAEFLGERIDAYLGELGFEAEKKRSFHLTLGRIRSDRNLENLLERTRQEGVVNVGRDCQVEKFLLMESILSSSGPQYRVKGSYQLQG